MPKKGQKPLGIIRTDDEIAEALRKAGGRPTDAATILRCSPATIWNRLKSSDMLREVQDECFRIYVDKATFGMAAIVDNPRHTRHFDACKFVMERGDKDRWGASLNVKASHSLNTSGSGYATPLSDRAFQPEAWDADEAARFSELMAIPVYDLTNEQWREIQDLKSKARVIELSPDVSSVSPPMLPSLSAPSATVLDISGEQDDSEESDDDSDSDD